MACPGRTGGTAGKAPSTCPLHLTGEASALAESFARQQRHCFCRASVAIPEARGSSCAWHQSSSLSEAGAQLDMLLWQLSAPPRQQSLQAAPALLSGGGPWPVSSAVPGYPEAQCRVLAPQALHQGPCCCRCLPCCFETAISMKAFPQLELGTLFWSVLAISHGWDAGHAAVP